MAKPADKGGRKGKDPATKKPMKSIKKNKEKRHVFTLQQKYFACELKTSGKKPKEIATLFEKRYGVRPKSSTLSSFYKKENLERYENLGHRETVMASVETTFNKTQRPTIMIDMEFALLCMLKKSLSVGNAVTKSAIKKMAKDIFSRLRALQIYNYPGERLQPLSQMSEEEINMLLSNDKKECPICHTDIYADAAALHEAMYEHISYTHGNGAPPTVGDERFQFVASDGWVRNFLHRHGMHNVTTVGEMGSADHGSANKYVQEFKDELIGRKISPKQLVHILINIDETGLVYKSVPKRTYKFFGQSFEAKKCSKDRVTVLVGASMDGFKPKPVVIGKAMRPRALLHTDMDALPVHYYGQPSAWMTREIMNHWFIFHLGPEIEAHYGENVNVILTLDNAGCHPPDLDTILEHVEVRYMPPNTTPIIQPMDQGVIYTLKRAFMERYYSKMIDYVMEHTVDVDPMDDFSKMYNMRDVVMDIGSAWATIDAPLIHKCFENLLCPEDYVKQYNETHSTAEQWPGINFRGFDTSDINSSEARGRKIKEYVDRLNNRLNDMDVTIDSDSVHEVMEYNPNEDVDTTELIQNGFYTQRLADGIDRADENDTGVNIREKTHECLKALTSIGISFRTEDYQNKEQAEKASEHLEGLQAIFRQMKITASGTPSQPRGASLGPLPGPSGSRTSQPASQPDEPVVAKFTALNSRPAATSSPGPSKSRQSQPASPPAPPPEAPASPPEAPASPPEAPASPSPPPPAEAPASPPPEERVNDTLDDLALVNVSIYGDADDTPAASPSAAPGDGSIGSIEIGSTTWVLNEDVLDMAGSDLADLTAASVSASARASAATSAMWSSPPPEATSPSPSPSSSPKRSRRSRTKHFSYQECYSDDFDTSSDEWEERK